MGAKSLLRRLFPPVSDAQCSNCALALRERRRRPCPRCGDLRRTFIRGMDLPARRRRWRWLPWPTIAGSTTAHDQMA